MERRSDALLRKTEELIAILRKHQDHAKLRALLEEIEGLRNRLLAQRDRRGPGH
jgi:hypothetical protein